MDQHERFLAWLDDGAAGPLPRDVAIHASVCTVCQQRIAALDALRAVDPGRAPLPPSRLVPVVEPGGLRAAGRFAGAAVAVTVVGTLLAVGAGQLVADRLGQTSPGGQVLDVTGTPGPATAAPSDRVPQPSATGPASPVATPTPTAQPRPVTPRPTARITPAPTPRATPTPTPTPAPTATPEPTAPASASPTPAPTAVPTASPSASASAGATATGP
jgi:hypothetical protein